MDIPAQTEGDTEASLPRIERVSADEFAASLQQFSAFRAAQILIGAEPETTFRIDLIRRIPDEEFSAQVANYVFGMKLAGDIGVRSTQSHPKTDYGDSHVIDPVTDK